MTDSQQDTGTVTSDEETLVITEGAAKEFKHILKQKGLPDDTGMRLSVKGGGCSGFEYQIDKTRF